MQSRDILGNASYLGYSHIHVFKALVTASVILKGIMQAIQ